MSSHRPVYVCVCVCMRVHACACVCMRVHACACVCMRACANTGVTHRPSSRRGAIGGKPWSHIQQCMYSCASTCKSSQAKPSQVKVKPNPVESSRVESSRAEPSRAESCRVVSCRVVWSQVKRCSHIQQRKPTWAACIAVSPGRSPTDSMPRSTGGGRTTFSVVPSTSDASTSGRRRTLG